MCIYCGTNKYREIYQNHFGEIPKDQDGVSFHIHHKDNNHSNNSPDNLIAVSIQEHYDIHYSQGDFHACLLLSEAMNLPAREKSELSTKGNLRRMEKGEHHFLDKEFQKEMAAIRLEKIQNGTHHLLGGKIQRKVNADRVANGTHNFLDKEAAQQRALARVANGTNPFLGGNKGKDHPQFNHTLYKFQHIKTGEIISSTMYDFGQKFKGTSVGQLIRGKLKTTGGWKLFTE
jgi:hypothetical protein